MTHDTFYNFLWIPKFCSITWGVKEILFSSTKSFSHSYLRVSLATRNASLILPFILSERWIHQIATLFLSRADHFFSFPNVRCIHETKMRVHLIFWCAIFLEVKLNYVLTNLCQICYKCSRHTIMRNDFLEKVLGLYKQIVKSENVLEKICIS